MADRPQVSEELSRDLSLFHITMMGLGMMIGAGVFIGIGISMGHAGPGGVVLTFALNGVIAIFTAMSFAELSSAIPRAGGAYNFARIAFGRGPSFLAGWMEWFASSVAGSLYAVVFATYTLSFLAGMGLLDWLPISLPLARKFVAVSVAGFFIYVNYRGSSETGKVGAFFTLGQMLFVLSIAAVGIVMAIRQPDRLQNFHQFLPYGWWRLLGVMGAIYVAFEGFEVIAQAGDEAIEPRRNIPKAMLYSVLIVTFTYVAVAFATVVAVRADMPELQGMLPWKWIGMARDTGFGKAVKQLMPFGSVLVTLAVIFSSTSALNATIFSATRASYALGRDGMLPAFFARISPKRKTPWVALAFTAALIMAAAILIPAKTASSSTPKTAAETIAEAPQGEGGEAAPEEGEGSAMHLAATASIMFLFLFFLVNISAIRIRRNMGDELQYGYVMPLFPLFPVLAIICQGALAGGIVNESPVAWIIAPAWVGAGVLVYHLYSRKHAATAEHEILVLEEERAPEGDEFRIMVAVANPDNALELVRNTYRLCEAKKARVELLHMVPVPGQVPLADAKKYMEPGQEGIVEAMIYLSPMFPISSTLRYCRNIARGIISALREKRADMLIMGWHGRHDSSTFNIGSTVDPVIELAPCSVVVFKGCGNREFRRILVPLAGGPNGAFALEVATILAHKDEGEVTAFTVARGKSTFDIDDFVARAQNNLYLPRERIHTRVIEAGSVVDAILEEAPGHDLIVLGCTRESFLAKMTRETVPEIIARRCEQPVVMVKASGGIRSWVKRWV